MKIFQIFELLMTLPSGINRMCFKG